MLKALTNKMLFIFKGLFWNSIYLFDLEHFNARSQAMDTAEITSKWLLGNRCVQLKQTANELSKI